MVGEVALSGGRKLADIPLFSDVDADGLGRSTLSKPHHSLCLRSVCIPLCNHGVNMNSENVIKHVKNFMKRKLHVCRFVVHASNDVSTGDCHLLGKQGV